MVDYLLQIVEGQRHLLAVLTRQTVAAHQDPRPIAPAIGDLREQAPNVRQHPGEGTSDPYPHLPRPHRQCQLTPCKGDVEGGDQEGSLQVPSSTVGRNAASVTNNEDSHLHMDLERIAAVKRELSQGLKKPFTEILEGHLADLHALGQKPITFLRQVIAICTYPELLNDKSLPEDVKEKAQRILQHCDGGSIGSYNDTEGLRYVRHDVAKHIERRDGGVPSHPNDILLLAGVSQAVLFLLEMMSAGEGPTRTGVLVPVPHSTLYPKVIDYFNIVQVGYKLEEENNWALNVQELRRALHQARAHCNPRVLCIINPSNPTGQVQSRKCIEDVIQFAAEERLFLLADEVYQDCVFGEGCKFHSFKKVLFEMGPEYSERVELVSLHSISEGYHGEKGFRGGYMEILNMDKTVKDCLYDLVFTNSSPPVLSQVLLGAIMDPPQPTETSYQIYMQEKTGMLKTLAENAKLTEAALNSVPGIRCNPVQAGMYCFPRIDIPPKAMEQAKVCGLEPDLFYCLRLLEETGVALFPGSVFGQRDGSYHVSLQVMFLHSYGLAAHLAQP
nr:PREDICTED: alanine aminotransferase 2-like [Latimeria chalumnae]|eukprot:XP_005996852.2 PREDICTED: alanine aminotransferase 2-like [Latimeria chalumnae]